MRDTWYVLENGKPADPLEVAPDKHGVLRHKSGIAVAIGPHGPKSTGVDLEEMKAAAAKTAEMQPEPPLQAEKPKQTYKTRGS